MAEILCPNCQKPNAEVLEICQFCGTQLKNRGTEPLASIHPGEAPIKQHTADLEQTLPGWLRDIRKGDSGEIAASNAQNAALSAGGNPSQSAQPAKPEAPIPPPAPSPAQNKANEGMDWLAGLSQANDEEDAVPDWLAGLKTNLPAEPAPAPEQPPAPLIPPIFGVQNGGTQGGADEQPADWLAGLQADSQPQQPASEQPTTANWGFNDQPVSFNDAEESAAPVSEETPDWLMALKAQDKNVNAPAPAQFAPADDIPSSDNLPDWLNNLGGEAVSAPAASFEMPPPAASELPSSGDLPGWLADMAPAESKPAHHEPPAGAAPGLSSGDAFPDWLANLGETSQPAPVSMPSEPVTPDSSSSADFPDWLAGLGGESALETGAVVEAPASAPVVDNSPVGDSDSTLPDWLAAAAAEKPPEMRPAGPSAAKAFDTGSLKDLGALGKADELPDWMASLGSTSPASIEPGRVEPEQVETPAASSADTFDWLSDLNQGASSPIAAESQAAGQPESIEEKPEAVSASFDLSAPEASTPSLSPDSGNAQNLDSILSMEMPDWLSGFTPAELDVAQQQGTGNEQSAALPGDISQADLPSWVQAMRPIESMISGAEGGEEEQTVEKEGPLAGLRSVLPAQTNAPGQRKPKAYSIKLQVDSTQLAQAALLEKLIASEAESRPVSIPRRIVNIRPLRWIIAVVLLLAVLAPALIGSRFFPSPVVDKNNEIGHFYSLVQDLPDVAPVLVVFDYQPGYAGEMEQAARPVIEHLIQKNTRMAFVSTSPTGVLMNERIMAYYPSYLPKQQYVDLGYLPGDAAGIQVFAQDPQGTLGNDFKQDNLWASDALKGVVTNETAQLSNFGALIVLTDNPDTGRMWIEQTGQALRGKPMLMVVSAQAAPMMRPYYQSGQVSGMVSGLAGGRVYEETTQQPGNASLYWDSYGIGMIAAELLMVLGGAWALIEHFRMRRAEQEQEEDET